MEGKDRRAERRQHVQKRLQVFNELADASKIDELMLSYEHAEQLIRFMDMGLTYFYFREFLNYHFLFLFLFYA